MTDIKNRVVYDKEDAMGYKYRARIEERKTVFGAPRWIFVIDRHFMGWNIYRYSRKFKSEAEATAAAHEWLDEVSTWRGTAVG